MKLQKTIHSDPASKKSVADHIGPLAFSDIGQVAEMSQKYFPTSKEVSIPYLKETLEELYFKSTDRPPSITPLVSKTEAGVVNGFLGVTANLFLYNGTEITVANCHHLMATEEARSRLIPMRMLQRLLDGPQDISFADGSVESTRHLWKRLGGSPSIVDSLYYKVPLRPVSFVVRPFLGSLNNFLGSITKGLARGADVIGGAIRVPLFHRSATDHRLVPLTAALLVELFNKVKKRYTIFPRYEQSKLERLFRLLSKEKRYGKLHKFAVMDKKENLIGWFIYYAPKGGVCEVIQAVCMSGEETELFNTLSWHAYEQGGIELSGRLMTNHLRSPFTNKSVCLPARKWTLIHSSNSELKLEIQSGNAFLTRLEGDLGLI